MAYYRELTGCSFQRTIFGEQQYAHPFS